MKQFYKLFAVLLGVMVLTGVMASVALAQDPANGKVIWEEKSNCQRCHGPAGEGMWGPPLAGNQNSVQDFITQVRTPRRNMPAFSAEQISDEMITNIHAYLTSLTAPASYTRPDAGLPADAPAGQVLVVEKRCVACHSITGPVKPFIERGEVPTIEAVLAQLRTPRRFMPTFNANIVSDAEAATIVEFLVQEFQAEAPPAGLPTSGGSQPLNWPVWIVVTGSLLFLAGLGWRRFAAR